MAAGDVYRSGNDVRTSGDQFEGIPQDTGVYYLENEDIRWNLNRCEVIAGSARLPAYVNWYAALAFARYYGYDLPTDAEWEKAARGPDHDDLGEHWLYPWGNTISTANANLTGTRTDVGTYNGGQTPPGPDMINAYGLYDVIGNAALERGKAWRVFLLVRIANGLRRASLARKSHQRGGRGIPDGPWVRFPGL